MELSISEDHGHQVHHKRAIKEAKGVGLASANNVPRIQFIKIMYVFIVKPFLPLAGQVYEEVDFATGLFPTVCSKHQQSNLQMKKYDNTVCATLQACLTNS